MKLNDFVKSSVVRLFSCDRNWSENYLAPEYPSQATPYHFNDDVSPACHFFNNIDNDTSVLLLKYLR